MQNVMENVAASGLIEETPKRSRTDRMLLGLVIFQIFIACLVGYRMYDTVMTKRMLNARKMIQTTGVKALNRKDIWSEDDKVIIANNWTAAAYDGEPNPFPEYIVH